MIRAAAIAVSAALMALPAAVLAQSPEEKARIAVIARASPSVVQVRATLARPARSAQDKRFDAIVAMMGEGSSKPQEGSGFVVDSARGLVVTAAHLVDGAERVEVVDTTGTATAAQIALSDPAQGIAILRVAGLKAPALALSGTTPAAGENLLVIGWMAPARALLPFATMAMGTIRFTPETASDKASVGPYLALDRSLPLGSYGGAPVLDSGGKVAGLVTATYGRDFGSSAVTLMLPLDRLPAMLAKADAANRPPR